MKKSIYALFMFLGLMFSSNINAQDNSVIYTVNFADGFNNWTAEGAYSNQGMWDAPSYENCLNCYGYMATESGFKSYFVSPEIDLAADGNTVSFNHKGFYFTDIAAETDLLIRADKGEWVVIEGIQYPQNFEKVNSGELTIPSEFNGKKVQFAFFYTIIDETLNSRGNWFIFDFTVKGKAGQSQKKEAGISFDVEEATYTIGDENFKAPVLNNPNNLEVYYSSENESVAIIDEFGELEIVGQGSALIRALTLPTEEFEKGEASYVLKVVDPSTVFIAPFKTDACGFVEESTAENKAWSFVNWSGCINADAYSKVNKMTAFYFISPQFTLDATGNAISFDMMTSYFTDIENQAEVVIREVGGEWVKITGFTYPVDEGVDFHNSGVVEIPAEFNGKNVELAFRYSSDGDLNSGLWYIKNLLVSKFVPTGINEVNVNKANDGKIYDIQGRRVNNPSNGLYIVNGKKVIIK